MSEITVTAPRFRQGAGRLCLDFVRTLRRRGTPGEEEELPDGGALAEWVRQCGPAIDGPRTAALPDAARARSARALREGLYALVTGALSVGESAGALSTGTPVARRAGAAGLGDSARGRLNRAAAEPVPVPYLTPSGELRHRAADPVTAVLALVARDALELTASPDLLARLRVCAAEECGAVFLDQSRPGTRRWCSMDVCGNRAKKSALRARTPV